MKIKVTNKGINIALGVLIVIVIYASFQYVIKDDKSTPTASRVMNQENIIGKLKYLDCYFFFNQGGKVIASEVIEDLEQNTKDENKKTAKQENPIDTVTSFEGLEVPYVQVGEVLPVKDKQIFNTIIAMNRMFQKNGIKPSYITISKESQIHLFYDEIEVNLGVDTLLEEKMTRLTAILPSLKGMSGVLHLEDFQKDTKNIIFSKKQDEVEVLKVEESPIIEKLDTKN